MMIPTTNIQHICAARNLACAAKATELKMDVHTPLSLPTYLLACLTLARRACYVVCSLACLQHISLPSSAVASACLEIALVAVASDCSQHIPALENDEISIITIMHDLFV